MRLISTDVGQGSVLGTLLFLNNINDLLKSFRVLKFSLYADEICLSLVSNHFSNLMDVFNSEVANLDSWFKANYLNLNSSQRQGTRSFITVRSHNSCTRSC